MRLVLCACRTLSPKPNQTLKYVVLHIMVYRVLRIIHPPPSSAKKLCERIFMYTIRPPFTARLLPVLYAATMIAGKQIFHMLMALRKANFGIPVSVTFVDRLSQSYNKLLFSLKFVATRPRPTTSSASNLA